MIIFTKKKGATEIRDQRSEGEGEGVVAIENSGKLIIYSSCLLVIYIYIYIALIQIQRKTKAWKREYSNS